MCFYWIQFMKEFRIFFFFFFFLSNILKFKCFDDLCKNYLANFFFCYIDYLSKLFQMNNLFQITFKIKDEECSIGCCLYYGNYLENYWFGEIYNTIWNIFVRNYFLKSTCVPVGKITKKQSEEVRFLLIIRHSKYSAMLSKTHLQTAFSAILNAWPIRYGALERRRLDVTKTLQ